LNGIDYSVWNPATDPHLVQPFDIEHLEARAANKAALQQSLNLPMRADVPLLGMVTRLDEMKGLDLVKEMLDRLMLRDVQFVLLGEGDAPYQEFLNALPRRFPQKAAVAIRFDAALAQQIYGGADMFLAPSRFEPCGLSQLIAMYYGCIPVVRATGGLADTVTDFNLAKNTGTGFVFNEYAADAFWSAIERALTTFADKKVWGALQKRAMRADFSWAVSAKKYQELYRKAIEVHK
jgi:starch synthase